MTTSKSIIVAVAALGTFAAAPLALADPSLASSPATPAASATPETPATPAAAAKVSLHDEWVARAHAHLDEFYGPLFRKLALAPQAQAALADLIVQKQVIKGDAINAAKAKNTMVNSEQIAAYQRETNEKIRALLGPAGFQTYVDYQLTFRRRTSIRYLNTVLAPEDQIGPELEEQLCQLYVDLAHARAVPGGDVAPDMLGLTLAQGARVTSAPLGGLDMLTRRARRLLNHNQMEALQTLVKSQHEKHEDDI